MIPNRYKPPRRRPVLPILAAVVVLVLLGVLLYNMPFVNERLAWRVEAMRASIKYALSPPEEVLLQVSTPQSEPAGVTVPPTATLSPSPTPTHTPAGPTETPIPSPTPTLDPTPLPAQAMLEGFTHMYQTWNNCGPANLAMALSYWGWQGTQRDTAAFTKPNPRDKNVMPYEMADFVADETDLTVMARVGGDIETLKAFIAAGFPVIVEKGFEGPGFDGWMGHYQVVNGYDDGTETFFVQDSYKGPNLRIPYADMQEHWRAFNNTYIVVYPPEREAQVLSILGPHADPNYNYQHAAELAARETDELTGRDQFFAWFNRGTNLVRLHDYAGAATAYDAAFANYPSIPEDQRPWRMLWYQTGPYFAYYFSGRYENVIELATTTLNAMSEPILEESYYWRARVKIALGDNEGAIQDLRKSLEVHPDFIPSLEQLEFLGVEP